ncbi:phage tail tape measure protein [Prevotella sp. MGM2]|uniref:phage tail tape measure protein n=1 Tax=Prevotella sp. MGM2 TaxID=2033406 RepID=UPI000CEA6735|nr:phage tail tape measure protein [Prevotella sp. MGM2]GAY30664.1 hypothetical protein PvtlMGM2_1517 [Prevotella sp. MGM2]
MADYKDYIVRYDIIADVTKAAEGLQSIATIAKEFEGPMQTLQKAITQVSQSVYQLKQNSQITFAPKIDTGAFNNQLRAMVTQVRSAAAEMHSAIFQALSGNSTATQTAQKGIGSALNSPRTVAAIKKDIESYNRELDKLLGTPQKNKKGDTIRNRDGLIQMTKNGLAKASVHDQAIFQEKLMTLETQKRAIQNIIQQRKAELAMAEKLEKEAAAQQAKTTKAQSSAITATSRTTAPQPAKLTNVTPAVIREWKKAFGDAKNKSLTVNIRGNASGSNGALTVIEQIQTSLKSLQSQASFNINPVLNTEGFAAAEAQLRQLASLSAAVVAPFTSKDTKVKGKPGNVVSTLTKEEKTRLADARKQIKTWNDKIAPIQQRLDANRAIPEEQRTPAVKGQITRDAKTLATYQANRAEQENIVRNLQGRSVAAVQSTAKAIKPLALDIVGNLSKINVTAKPPVVPIVGEITKLEGKITEAIPVNVKIMSDQVAASVRSITPKPVLDVQVHLVTDQAKQQLQTLASQTKPIQKPVTQSATGSKTTATTPVSSTTTAAIPPTAKTKKASSKATVTSVVDTRDVIRQIKEIPRQTIPVAIKLMWERGAIGRQEQLKKMAGTIPPIKLSLDSSTALVQLEEFIAKIRAASPQNIKLTATGVPAVHSATTPTPASKPAVVSQPKQQTVTSATKKTPVVDSTKQLNQPKIPPVSLTLDTTGAVAALEEFIAKVRAASPQNIKLTATGVPANTPTQATTAQQTPVAPTTPTTPIVPPIATGGTTQQGKKQTGHTGHQPLTVQERYDRQRQQSEERARKQRGDNRFRAAKHQEYISQQQAWYAQQQSMYNHLFRNIPRDAKPDVNWIQREQAKRNAELARMRADATAAFATPTPYEAKERAKAVANSINRHQQQATRLRAQAYNSMLPFAQSKEQVNMLTKHRKFFRQAVATTGIVPTPGMEAPQMLRYLQGVSSQMQQASVAVPWQLQSQINKLEGQIAKSKGIGESSPSRSAMAPMPVRQKPFFDRTRKWAYPFTGQTSFGVRTPMAVDMAKGMGVMFAIGGAMSAIGSSFSQAMEYQNTMRTTQAILQNGTDSYSQNAFKNMEGTVRNVGVKTKFSAPEVASAARFLAMAGYDIDAINDAIRPIADLALIGDSDLGETADKMTNIMTTFQIAPERMREAANIMATTATRSNTDLMMLAESAKYGGGVANMYGRNDPNLFADTMALFGVMGNAGIQASSAGTALRMMYQNLFKPNKNQQKVLDMMNQSYGITTLKEDGSYRAMSDILIEMAQRIPENQMAQIVGNLFRITAQPGAAATLLAAAGGDKGIAEEIGSGIEMMSNKMSSKAGMSSLVSLMLANRNSVNGNISGAIAEEKQNTITGLWAQVTSTFTEGIVQAFEKRQGGFEGILKKLRDYLAKPETIQIMQNLLDMIIEIGKVMAWFVKIWASLYNAAPNMIKWWVILQMGITQMGALNAPVVSLIGVFDRLKGAILWLAGVSSVAGTSVARNVTRGAAVSSAANAAMMGTPLVVGQGKWGKQTISGNTAARARQAMTANAILAGELALSGASRKSTLETLNKETRQHYAAVRERAARIYGPSRAVRAFKTAATTLPTMASLAPMFGGLKSMLMGLLTGLAKAAWFLVNPVTLAVGAVAGLGYGLYKLKQRIDGTSEAQQRARVEANKAADQTTRELTKEGKWYQDYMNENIPAPSPVISSINTQQIEQYKADEERFKQLYATIFNDFSKDASKQSINDVSTKWRSVINSNPAFRLAIGNAANYDFSKKHKQLDYNPYNNSTNGAVALWNLWHADEDNAINQRNGMVQDALMIEGANDIRTQQAIRNIAELRQKFLNGEIASEAEYQRKAQEIRTNFMSQFTAKLPAAGMTPEQFQQTSNRSVYDTYQLGAQNLLDATINGKLGTMTGKMNAYQWLSDAENRAKLYTAEWYNAISNIIGDYHIIYDALSDDGQLQAKIELELSTLSDGSLDFTNILKQIRDKVANFNLTVQGFSDIIGTAYKMMAEAGVIDIKDRNSLRNQIRHQMTGAKYNDKTPEDYYDQWIRSNSNSEWVKAGISKKQYVDFIMGRSGETLNLGNRIVSRSEEKKQMWRNMAGKTADKILEQNQNLINQAEKMGNQNNNTPQGVSTPTTPTSVNNQTAYASPYERSAAKPTQVIININELAHFDRTAIASNADERDLMAAMEERIAGAVYQIFAEASNQSQRIMDLT